MTVVSCKISLRFRRFQKRIVTFLMTSCEFVLEVRSAGFGGNSQKFCAEGFEKYLFAKAGLSSRSGGPGHDVRHCLLVEVA